MTSLISIKNLIKWNNEEIEFYYNEYNKILYSSPIDFDLLDIHSKNLRELKDRRKELINEFEKLILEKKFELETYGKL